MTDRQGMQWTDAFLLGYDAMDETHREFVDVVNRLLTCADSELASLRALRDSLGEMELALKRKEEAFVRRQTLIGQSRALTAVGSTTRRRRRRRRR